MQHLVSRLLLALALVMMSMSGAAAPVSAVSDLDVADINKSVVWIDTVYDATVEVPFQDGTSQTYETEVYSWCTGWFASDIGHVATAGHCLEFGGDLIAGLYRNVVVENNLDIGNARYEDLTWDYSVSDPAAYVGQPSGVAGGPLSGETSVIAQVLDQEEFMNGDNAVLKIANMTGTPALPIATEQPQVGDEVTAIGFAGSVGRITDTQRQPPSFKKGNVSSLSTSSRGVPYTEIDAAVTQGMSGGPTVNERGEVIGINSFLIRGESQPFNFVTDTQTMRVFLEDNGVEMVQAPAAGPDVEAAVEAEQTQAVGSAEAPAAASDSSSSQLMILIVVMGALLLVALGVLGWLLVRQRRTASATDTPGIP